MPRFIMSLPSVRRNLADLPRYVPGASRAATGVAPIKLSANESALGPSPMAREAFVQAAGQLYRYPDGSLQSLRDALARHHGLESERILCAAGSDELLIALAQLYATDGDEVIFPEYGFLIFRVATVRAGARPVPVKEQDYRVSVDHILREVTEKTRLVFLANPNNPTGTYLDSSELMRLEKGLPGHVLLVIDAAYAELVARVDYDSGLELARDAHRVVVTRTFSKAHGLAALRVGWAYGPRHVAEAYRAWRAPFPVGAAAQEAAMASLNDAEHQRKVREHNDRWLPWLTAELARLGLVSLPGVANFVTVRFGDTSRGAGEAHAFLRERGILVRPLSGYGMGEFLRITIGKEEDNRLLVSALSEFQARRRAEKPEGAST